jgi:hypothetical protein
MISRDELISRLGHGVDRPLFREQSYYPLSRQDSAWWAS